MRTDTYLSADFDNDKNAVDRIYYLRDLRYISFKDAHDEMQANDDSLPCSIKKSLKQRLDMSKSFILIVGEKTKLLTKGGCQLCSSYNSYTQSCTRQYSVDYDSFVKYECKEALEAYNYGLMKIVVFYKGINVNKDKCVDELRNVGYHYPIYTYSSNGELIWNDNNIINAFRML